MKGGRSSPAPELQGEGRGERVAAKWAANGAHGDSATDLFCVLKFSFMKDLIRAERKST